MPPYFTAEPEITTTEVQPGDCVVLATDGLWDCLTTEELMGWWAPMQCLPTGGA
jgi:pyruvate dehydrogenase phosphatase